MRSGNLTSAGNADLENPLHTNRLIFDVDSIYGEEYLRKI